MAKSLVVSRVNQTLAVASKVCFGLLKRHARVSLAVILSVQIGLAPAVVMADSNSSSRASSSSAGARVVENYFNHIAMNDPVFAEFFESAKATSSRFEHRFDAKDPAIDKDPYFMRSQRWQSAPAGSKYSGSAEFEFTKYQGHVLIRIPEAKRVLDLRAPVTPFHVTDEFIFFSVDETSDLFQKAAGPGEAAGEGLFFISKEDLLTRSASQASVPLYHFPLPGTGWTGKIDALEFPQPEVLGIANEVGDTLAIEFEDIQTLMKAQQINLMLATAQAVRESLVSGRGVSEKDIYPTPGSTAAFGLFYTGLNLKNPKQSLWQGASIGALPGSSFLRSFETLMVLNPFASEKAHAIEFAPEVIEKIIFIGSVLSAMLATSVVLKYGNRKIKNKLAENEILRAIKTLDRQEKQEILRKIENNEASLQDYAHLVKKPGIFGRIGKEIRETFDVFAHTTMTASQVNVINTATAIEVFFDRFAPAAAGAEHTLIRRFLNNTYFFSRKTVKQTPVNSKTFMLGAVVMGGVDTGLVGVQYLAITPWICEAAIPYLGASFEQRVERTFAPNNPETMNIVVQDTVRNGLSYLQSGASSYSMETKAQINDIIERQVDEELKAMGIDPKAPQHYSRREKMISEKVDLEMQRRGMPGNNEFLFDYTTIFDAATKSLGYTTPEGLQVEGSFILAKRFGLTYSAIKRAVDTARADFKTNPGETERQVLSILEETEARIGDVFRGVLKGKEGIQQAKKTRIQVTLLSYEGPVDLAVKYLPEAWKTQHSPEAARGAALQFRRALYSYAAEEGRQWVQPNPKDVEKYAEQARERAIDKVINSLPELKDLPKEEARLRVRSEYLYEFRMQTQLEIVQIAREQGLLEKAKSFKPKKKSWYTLRQEERAVSYANDKMNALVAEQESSAKKSSFSFGSEEWRKKWMEFYTHSMTKSVGLNIEKTDPYDISRDQDTKQMLASVEKMANDSTDGYIKNEPGLKEHLQTLLPYERMKYEASIYAANYLASYQKATTQLGLVDPLSPNQPGAFQKLRQKKVIRSHRWLTKPIRWVESIVEDQALQPGLYGKLVRTVPLLNDIVQAHHRSFKTALATMTTGYLWSRYVWQVELPYGTWAIFIAGAALTISVPHYWLTRMFRMDGTPPMDGIMAKLIYAFPYSMLTFSGMMPILLYSPDANLFFSEFIRDPFLGVIDKIPREALFGLGAAALTGYGAGRVSRKIKKELAKPAEQGQKKSLFVRTCQALFKK